MLHVIDLGSLQSVSIMRNIHRKSELENARTQLLRYLKAGAEIMLKEKVENAKKIGVNIRFTLGVGSTPQGIVDVAKDEKVDLIVMGSKGLSSEENKLHKLKFLGGVARRVLEESEYPVLIVK